MELSYEPIDSLIKALTQNTNIHISIHDLTGILNNNILCVNCMNQTHTTPFCRIAKNYSSFPLCMRSKTQAINKAIREQKTIEGYCCFGLYEFVKAVVIDDFVRCIIFVGNIVIDKEETIKRINDTCMEKNIAPDEMIRHIKYTEQNANLETIKKIPDIIDSYIRLIYRSCDISSPLDKCHWVIQNIKNYIESNYDENISLKNLSGIYFMNEKYVGTLFHKQVGCSFREYLTKIRISHATNMLINTEKSITDIALDCGFQTVTYFNRVFLKFFGESPTEYRQKNALN